MEYRGICREMNREKRRENIRREVEVQSRSEYEKRSIEERCTREEQIKRLILKYCLYVYIT